MEISIVIPCYNHGHFIQEAIDSVLQCKDVTYELIIVDDGSTDKYTIEKIATLKEQGFQVIQQENHGLGYTRNAGIAAAKGKYILPLDADNKIRPEYIYNAIAILAQGKADIVYGNPIFFGDNSLIREFKPKRFDGTQLFFENYIDACAIYRKDVWTKLGGYDEKMPVQGHEDWDFWLNAFTQGFQFHHLNESLYYYRIVGNSMSILNLGTDTENSNYAYMLKKYAQHFAKVIPLCHTYSKIYRNDMNQPFRSIFKYLQRFLSNAKRI